MSFGAPFRLGEHVIPQPALYDDAAAVALLTEALADKDDTIQGQYAELVSTRRRLEQAVALLTEMQADRDRLRMTVEQLKSGVLFVKDGALHVEPSLFNPRTRPAPEAAEGKAA